MKKDEYIDHVQSSSLQFSLSVMGIGAVRAQRVLSKKSSTIITGDCDQTNVQ